MKDTFIGSSPPNRVNHFIFECEIFDEKDELSKSRDIQIQLVNFELLSPKLNQQ